MRLSSMADYAVVTMSAAARHCGGSRVSAGQLAEETGLPVLVAEEPLTCVVRGCGLALERMERLGSIFTSE